MTQLQQLFHRDNTWTQKWFARTPSGHECNFDSPYAACWCLKGAISHCYPTNYQDIEEKVRKILHARFPDYDSSTKGEGDIIVWWNDSPERTIEDIRQLVKEAEL